MDAVGDDLGATCGNIINCSYKLFAQTKPDGVLVLGDTNSCLSVIGAKRLHIPIFHMEAGNRCKDECLPEETNRRIVDIISDVNMAYSEHARRYLADCGLPKERTYVTGSPMAEVLHNNLAEIEASDVHRRLGLEKGNIFCSLLIVRKISTPRRTSCRSLMLSTVWQRSMTCRFFIVVIHVVVTVLQRVVSNLMNGLSNMSLLASMITIVFR